MAIRGFRLVFDEPASAWAGQDVNVLEARLVSRLPDCERLLRWAVVATEAGPPPRTVCEGSYWIAGAGV